MSLQQILPYLGGMLSVGGLIFKMGEHAEKIHVISNTVEAQEKHEKQEKVFAED